MQKARALRPGGTVMLIAPASPAPDEAAVARARSAVEQMGFVCALDATCLSRGGYLAGTDEARAAALTRAFLDDAVDAIFCLRGGYGCARLLERIDFALLAAHPKPFLGYSDITALHAALNARGLMTLHGPMGLEMSALDACSRRALVRALAGAAGEVRNPPEMPLVCLYPGACSGRLCGGNLAVLASLCGTPWQLDAAGKILLLEDVGEPLYRLDSCITQLKGAGVLDACAGVALGAFTRCGDGEEAARLLGRLLAPLKKPVLAGLAVGHGPGNIAVPLGALGALDAGKKRLTLLEGAFT